MIYVFKLLLLRGGFLPSLNNFQHPPDIYFVSLEVSSMMNNKQTCHLWLADALSLMEPQNQRPCVSHPHTFLDELFFPDPSARFSTQQKWWFIAQKSTSRRASWKSISKLTSYFRPPARPVASFMRTILSVSQSGRSHAVRNQNLIPELILMCLKCDYLPSTITQRSFDLRRLGELNDANHFRHATNLSAS